MKKKRKKEEKREKMVEMLQKTSESFMKERKFIRDQEKYQNSIYIENKYTHVLETQIKIKNVLISRLEKRIIELQNQLSEKEAKQNGATDQFIETLKKIDCGLQPL